MMDASDTLETTKLQISTEDETKIGATYFVDVHREIKRAILIAGATAVPQRFYTNFAKYLASTNCAVLTFDFRGVGDSLPENGLRKYSASLIDWGTKDIPACLKWLSEKHPDLPIHLIGHSAGAQLIGLIPRHQKLSTVIMLSASSGHVSHLTVPSKIKALFVFLLYAPLSSLLFGYVPGRKIGLGEDLPSGVMSQWATWCLRKGYVENSFGKEIKTHFYEEVSIPILAITPADDEIATDWNVSDFMRLLPNAQIEHLKLNPKEFNLKSIGHFNFFRKQSQVLWTKISDWFAKNEKTTV